MSKPAPDSVLERGPQRSLDTVTVLTTRLAAHTQRGSLSYLVLRIQKGQCRRMLKQISCLTVGSRAVVVRHILAHRVRHILTVPVQAHIDLRPALQARLRWRVQTTVLVQTTTPLPAGRGQRVLPRVTRLIQNLEIHRESQKGSSTRGSRLQQGCQTSLPGYTLGTSRQSIYTVAEGLLGRRKEVGVGVVVL